MKIKTLDRSFRDLTVGIADYTDLIQIILLDTSSEEGEKS